MTETKTTNEMLEDIGLSVSEIDIYLNFLGRGPLTKGEAVLAIGIDYDTFNAALDVFIEKGIVREIDSVPERYEAIPPYELFLKRFDNFAEDFKVIQTDITNTLEEGISRLGRTFEEIGSKIPDTIRVDVTGVDKIAEDLSRILEEMLDEQVKAFQGRILELLESRLADLKTAFDETGTTQLAKTQEDFQDLITKVGERMQELETEIDQARTGLNDLWSATKKGEGYKPKNIWFVPGENGIKAFFKDMVSRAKMNVTMITPKLNDIDVKILKALPPRVNIRIATFVDKGMTQSNIFLRELDEGNITIRNYDAQDFWGIMVDGTETLLAAVPPEGTEEIKGIACIAEEYNQVFRRFLSEIWLASDRL